MISLNKNGYTLLRQKLFGGTLLQSQVDGLEAILEAINDYKLPDKRQAAYILATAYHETAKTMQPIEEVGKGKGRAYGEWLKNGKGELYCWKNDNKNIAYLKSDHPYLYYGRGYVQLTWFDNYQVMANRVSCNLVKNPALAYEPDIAAQVMMHGMAKGLFTGKKLSDYIGTLKCDYINARRIINGTDKANAIAGYARIFEDALV